MAGTRKLLSSTTIRCEANGLISVRESAVEPKLIEFKSLLELTVESDEEKLKLAGFLEFRCSIEVRYARCVSLIFKKRWSGERRLR